MDYDKNFRNLFFDKNISIYIPIDRSRRAEFKYIIFDLIWSFFDLKKFKKPLNLLTEKESNMFSIRNTTKRTVHFKHIKPPT